MVLLPPPETTHDTVEEARKALNEHTGAQGCVLTIKRTKKVGNRKDGAINVLFYGVHMEINTSQLLLTKNHQLKRPSA